MVRAYTLHCELEIVDFWDDEKDSDYIMGRMLDGITFTDMIHYELTKTDDDGNEIVVESM